MDLYLIGVVVGLHEENLKQSKNGKKIEYSRIYLCICCNVSLSR